jgi:hypothetical protein
MNLNVFLIIVPLILGLDVVSCSQCDEWIQNHLFVTKNEEFLQKPTVVIKFSNFTELTTEKYTCEKKHAYKIVNLILRPERVILFDAHIDLRSMLSLFEFSMSYVTIHNIKGFVLGSKSFPSVNNEIVYLEFFNSIFEFYLNETHKVGLETCTRGSLSNQNFFGSSSRSLVFMHKNTYSTQICPYVFLHTVLEQVYFYF